MPSGTLAISKTRTPPATYQVTFGPNFSSPQLGLGSLTVTSLEDLRSLLSSIGILGREQENVVRAAIRDNLALLRDVVLTDGFITQHRL